MNIAIFTDTFYPEINGVVTATINLSKGLAKKGHKIYIITCSRPQKYEEFQYNNIIVKRLPSISAFFYPGCRLNFPFSMKLFKYLITEKINLIHFQTPFVVGVNAIISAKLLKIPLIGTFHTFIAHKDYRRYVLRHFRIKENLLEQFAWKYLRAYYNRCDLITTPTESAKNELLRNNFKKPIIVISNGIEIPDNIKENEDNQSLLFVGRISYEKNIFYLLDCFKIIARSIPEVKLIVVGDGPQMSDFQKKIKDEGLVNNIVLKGRIEYGELMKSSIFQNSKIFITSSLTETQGITMLEAQARGLVSVGVDANGTKDLITNGYNGFLVKEGDKEEFARNVVNLLSNKNLYKKMRDNTLKSVEKHRMDNIIFLWENTYLKLIQELKSEN